MCVQWDKEWRTLKGNGHRLMDTIQVFYYQVRRCSGCPLRSLCHQAKGNRTIEVNHQTEPIKSQSKEPLTVKRTRASQ